VWVDVFKIVEQLWPCVGYDEETGNLKPEIGNTARHPRCGLIQTLVPQAIIHVNMLSACVCVSAYVQEELALMKQFGSKGAEVVLTKVPYWML
jgi:hypothetical protein